MSRPTPIDPGERDRAVTIQQRPSADATSGDSRFPVETWTTLAERVYMRKVDGASGWGGERFQANQLSAPATTLWEMSYRADMDPELVNVAKLRRLTYQGRTYDILEANMIGRREGIELRTLSSGA